MSIKRRIGNKSYKLVYSTDERLGKILTEINHVNIALAGVQRNRIPSIKTFEECLKKQIFKYKSHLS